MFSVEFANISEKNIQKEGIQTTASIFEKHSLAEITSILV